MTAIKTHELIKQTSETLKESVNITTINVENIPCYSSIGIHAEEKKMGQQLIVDIYLDIAEVEYDDIKATVSYVDVYQAVQTTCKSKSYSLIEVLAQELADSLISFPNAIRAKIKVHKPHIPFPEFQGNVSVEVERTK